VELEIGAGFGSWIVHQAKQTQERNYLAIEMKADRVAQIVSRCALEQLSNLCIVGADCLSFLRRHVAPDSLANVYANHPEPPTQTFGLYDRDRLDRIANGGISSEPPHMLTSESLIQIGTCLTRPKSDGGGGGRGGGRFTIVTDNRNFVRLLTATVACAITWSTRTMQQQQQHAGRASSSSSLVLPAASKLASVGPERIRRDGSNALTLIESPTFSNGKVTVHVYEGKAGPGGNNNNNGRSYFDNLWNTGAGSHAERTSRFFIILERI
jgi:Putative methyltransferase